jgi:formate dehydrogenase iron-sulfur subunit
VSDHVRIDAPPAGHGTDTLVSRRRFLQGAAAGAAAVAGVTVAGALPSGALFASSDGPAAEGALGMLIDLTRCTGCNACALACKQANGMANPDVAPVQLDSDALSYVDSCLVDCGSEGQATVHIKKNCMHCLHPACASACTVGALRKTAEGPVVYDSAKCIGCRYCQYACPFGYPVYEWEGALGLISKCQMCNSRLAEGEKPACVDACPNGAVRFGTRTFLLAQAHAQIASNPGRYVDHVYGEHEVGGTSVLYLSPVPFTVLGFPALCELEIPHYAEAVMKKTPIVAVTVATLAAAVQAITRRRAKHLEYVPSYAETPAETTQSRTTQGGQS